MTRPNASPDSKRQLMADLLGPLHMHFAAAANAYRDYLDNGRTFLFACSLRRINEDARQLLIRHGYLLPPAAQKDALALIAHYDVWMTLWDDLAKRSAPRPDDQFVFENKVNFSKDARERLAALYEQLRLELT